MGRSKTQAKRRNGVAPSVQGGKSVGRPPGLTQTSGTQRPDSPTKNPPDIADPQARVIRTRG